MQTLLGFIAGFTFGSLFGLWVGAWNPKVDDTIEPQRYTKDGKPMPSKGRKITSWF
jgi:hypothetical protein